MSVFSTVATLIQSITIFQTGMFLAFFAVGFGLARAITKDSKHLPILFTTFLCFMGLILVNDLRAGIQLLAAAAIGTMLWFIPMWNSSTSKKDLTDE